MRVGPTVLNVLMIWKYIELSMRRTTMRMNRLRRKKAPVIRRRSSCIHATLGEISQLRERMRKGSTLKWRIVRIYEESVLEITGGSELVLTSSPVRATMLGNTENPITSKNVRQARIEIVSMRRAHRETRDVAI